MRCPTPIECVVPLICILYGGDAWSGSEATTGGLGYSLDEHGLSPRHNGQSLFGYRWNGFLKLASGTSEPREPGTAEIAPSEQPKASLAAQTVRLEYSWGVVTCTYARTEKALSFVVSVANTSNENVIKGLTLQLTELVFKQVPEGRTFEAGMWGVGGRWMPLYQLPLGATWEQVPPVIFVRFEGGTLAFVSEEDANADHPTISIPYTTNPTTKLMYPFRISFPTIPASGTTVARVSLRFSDAAASSEELVGDVLDRYRQFYPVELRWVDHRPIGALFLATSQRHPEKNPRGWFNNATDVDITTTEGLRQWRARLMKYADDSIAVLQRLNAQGMITWDPEGEEYPTATFYGDPRLASRLAPETEFKASEELAALDEYFRKFRAVGLRTGVALRPQQITFVDGVPTQRQAEDPIQELLEKIAYAKSRWGCTLFYIDSTYDRNGPLDANVFATVARRYPDVLLFPENETLRDFAYSAPLNSFAHHGVTSTPASVREVYPMAFSGLLASATDEKLKASHDALVAAVRRGDILIVNGWYGGTLVDAVKSIYQEAARPPD